MKTYNLEVTIDQAKEWYNSNNETLKALALKCFSEHELLSRPFYNIKTLADACEALDLPFEAITRESKRIYKYSRASSAMFELNIIRKALNLDQDLKFIKEPNHSYIHYPYNPFTAESSEYYKNSNSDAILLIGKVMIEEKIYSIYGNSTGNGGCSGLGSFSSMHRIGYANSNVAFLGCASKEIALHFSKYFGMLITEAKFGDIPGFKIVENYIDI